MKRFSEWLEEDHWKNFERWMTWPREQKWERRPILGGKYHVEVTPGRGNLDYRVFRGAKNRTNHIGRFYVRSNTHFGRPVLSVMNASVEEKHQKQGIGTAVYSMIRDDTKPTGLELWPQGPGGETSDEAKKLWRKFDPEKSKKMWGE
jgi:hypothetical protein